MKKILTRSLAAAMLCVALAGCSTQKPDESQAPAMTPEEYTQAYQSAIEAARDQELNEAIPVLTATDTPGAAMVLPMLGITDENVAAFAVALSPMNIRAYGIAAILPAEGKEEEVLEGVNAFVEQQKQSFQSYLVDQYEVANAAKVETLDDGTILLVMSEDQDTILSSIKESLGK